MPCQNCGHVNNSAARFCTNCGNRLELVISVGDHREDLDAVALVNLEDNQAQVTVAPTHRGNNQDQEEYFGLVTGVGKNGTCFIGHEKAQRGVFFRMNSPKEALNQWDVVVFQVDDWNKQPRPSARNVRKASSLSYGIILEWTGTFGQILPEYGTQPVYVDFRRVQIRPKDRKVLRVGDTVSYNVSPYNPEQVIRVCRDYSLRRFANLGDEWFMLENLAGMTLPEKWEYPGSKPFKILFNYLFYTFDRLEEEDKHLDQDERKIRIAKRPNYPSVAVFDTGLVNRQYKAIYAVFQETANAQIGQPGWRLIGFCARGEKINGFNYLTLFRDLPSRAEYFDQPGDLLYDPNLRLDAVTYHIVGERSDRLPATVRERIPRGMTNPDEILAFLDQQLEKAIERAQDRIRWNYKTAIPQYYPSEKRIQLLLPLCLDDPRKVDVALAVQREGEVYVAYTILELDWAYSNARLIARPDSDWLAVEALHGKEENDAEE